MTIVTTQTFDAAVLQSKVPVIVMWGGQANPLANIMAATLDSYLPCFTALAVPSLPPSLTRVDIDTDPSLAMKYSVRAVPSLMLFVNGQAMVAEVDLQKFITGAKKWLV